MTTVYGVTPYGAKKQIRGQLEDLNFPQEHLPTACKYLAELTFRNFGKMFTSAKNIQVCLDCVHYVAGISRRNDRMLPGNCLSALCVMDNSFYTQVNKNPNYRGFQTVKDKKTKAHHLSYCSLIILSMVFMNMEHIRPYYWFQENKLL